MIESAQSLVGRLANAGSVSITAPAAVALAIVLIAFVALSGLIGYGLWRAMQQRSSERRQAARRDRDKNM